MIYLARIEYDGTDFFGWQIQRDKRTIQGEIMKALKRITGISVKVVGASRTDRGVHARGQLASFHFPEEPKLGPEELKRAMNAILPHDIYIHEMKKVDTDFNARYRAKKKKYVYRILPEKRSPIRRRFLLELPFTPDLEILNESASYLKGTIDFSFLKIEEGKSPNVKFEKAMWYRVEDEYVFEVVANRFLYKLVRMLVGMMLKVAWKFKDAGAFKKFLDGEDEHIWVVPPRGLTLDEVYI